MDVEFNIDNIEVGKLLKIESIGDSPHKGVWKVVEVEKSVLEPEGECPCIRVTLTQDTNMGEDRIYMEVYPEMDRETFFILYPFDVFGLEEAEKWPPSTRITMGGEGYTIFESCDIDTVQNDEDHEGYDRTSNNGKEFTHWEYKSTDEKEVLQIILEDDLVLMNIGYPLPASAIQSI